MEEKDNGKEIECAIDVTPIVNVSLVLVLVFMVTSPYFVRNLAPVTLPRAVSAETEHDENITITISPDEGFFVNEEAVARKSLARALRRAVRSSGISFVLIRADERVPHGEVEDAMRLAKRAGVKRIAFATAPKIR